MGLCFGASVNCWAGTIISCPENAVKSNAEYRLVKDYDLYLSWKNDSRKVINEKASRILKETVYHAIDGSEKVVEISSFNNKSLVRVIEPDHLKGVSRWVNSDTLKSTKVQTDVYSGKISSYIYDDRPNNYLKGQEGLKNSNPSIKSLEIMAAQKVIDSKKCDFVESSFVATESTIDNIKIIVDCTGRKRFTLTKSEILSGNHAQPDTEKVIPKAEAINLCSSMLYDKLGFKEGVNVHDILGSTYYQAPSTGRVEVKIDFDVSQTKYQARCLFSVDNMN